MTGIPDDDDNYEIAASSDVSEAADCRRGAAEIVEDDTVPAASSTDADEAISAHSAPLTTSAIPDSAGHGNDDIRTTAALKALAGASYGH